MSVPGVICLSETSPEAISPIATVYQIQAVLQAQMNAHLIIYLLVGAVHQSSYFVPVVEILTNSVRRMEIDPSPYTFVIGPIMCRVEINISRQWTIRQPALEIWWSGCS